MSFIIQRGTALKIEHKPGANETLAFAAGELRRYLAMIIGDSASNGNVLKIELCLKPLQDLGDEGFEIKSASGQLMITGGGPAGVVYGVYYFLRHYGGCQFSGLGPDNEFVPGMERIEVPEGALRQKPKLWYRGLQFSRLEDFPLTVLRLDWMAKNGMNYVMVNPRRDVPEFRGTTTHDPATGRAIIEGKSGLYTDTWVIEQLLPEIRKRGLKLDMNHHNFFYWLPPEIYFGKHPEWFALIDGKRSRERHQMCVCTSNPEAVREMISNIKAFLRKTPEARIIGVIPEDGTGMCQCDNCRKMDLSPDDALKPYRGHRSQDAKNSSKSRRYALLLNEVARAISDDFPEIMVGAAAYVDLQWPSDITLEPNIVPWVAIYWRCAAHELAPKSCYMNEFFFKLLKEWKQAHKGKLILYEYYMGMNAQRGLPYPMADEICREWPLLKQIGIEGATIQSCANDHHVYALNYLAFARSGWEDKVDYSQLLDDFLAGMFGKASKHIRPIYEMFHHKIRQIELGQVDSPYLKPYPPAIGCLLPNGMSVAYFLDKKGRDLMFRCIENGLQHADDDRARGQLLRFRNAASYWALAADFYETGFAIKELEKNGKKDQAALMAAEGLKRFEPELERLAAVPPDGWIRAIEVWVKQSFEFTISWFRDRKDGKSKEGKE